MIEWDDLTEEQLAQLDRWMAGASLREISREARTLALDVAQAMKEEELGVPCVAQFAQDGRTILVGPALRAWVWRRA